MSNVQLPAVQEFFDAVDDLVWSVVAFDQIAGGSQRDGIADNIVVAEIGKDDDVTIGDGGGRTFESLKNMDAVHFGKDDVQKD